MIDLNFISKISLEYSKAREENGSIEKLTTLNLLKHCAAEVVEATEAYTNYKNIKEIAEDLTSTNIDERWESQEEPDTCEEYYQECVSNFSTELADVIMCVLIIAAHENIDIEEALKACLDKNRKRADLN